MNKNDPKEANNVYAATPSGKIVHVSDAIPGKKGYFCLGCKKEMQAVLSKTGWVVDYFRHDPEAVKNQPKCAYRDIEYRNGIAIRSLLRDKRITVPAIIKFPPNGMVGEAYQLQEMAFIEAVDAKPRLSFFECIDGQVKWSDGDIPEDAILLTKAAVTFFDASGQPILLIELSGESKMTVERRVHLKRLGLDVVRVSVPRDAPDAIERIFQVTANTKWIYSHEEDNTTYDLQFASGSGEALLDIGSDQGELFQENFNCRAAEIRSLVRTIDRCLESKPYADIASRLRSAIAEVGKFIERDQRRLGTLQDQHRGSIEEAYQGEEGEIATSLELAEADAADLERRYFGKIEEIGREQRACDAILRAGEGKSLEGTDGIERRRRELIKETRRIEAEIREIEATSAREVSRIAASMGSIEDQEATLGEQFAILEDEERNRFEQTQAGLIGKLEADQSRRSGLQGAFEAEEATIEREFERLRAAASDRIARRDQSGNSEFSSAIGRLLAARRLVEDWRIHSQNANRARAARNAFEDKSYKGWGAF